MPHIPAASAPKFRIDTTVFTGLAAPSRGARETSVWRVCLAPHSPGAEHSLDREEVLVFVSGRAVAQLDGHAYHIEPGDGLVVPAHQSFSLANPFDAPCEAIAVLPVGGQATLVGGAPFTPPWTE